MDQKLNILILTLSTGEEVIANVKDHIEIIDGEERKVCYNMIYPFVLTKSGPISAIALRVLIVPLAAQSNQVSNVPALYSGKQSPRTAEQIFIIKIYFIIDSPI